MTDKMREEFEFKFPLPGGVAWKDSIGMYEVVDIWKLDQAITISRYNWLWEGWQASREALAIELPEYYQYDSPGEVIPVLKDCRAAIEAAGLKVAP
jgi:hypothetical protein